MNQGLLTLAALSLTAAAALPAVAQVNTSSISVRNVGTFNLAEAYPCVAGTYASTLGIAPPGVFTGNCPPRAGFPGAAPGILCLQRTPGGFALNVNCFAVVPSTEAPPVFIQAYRLIKEVPGSFKCPDVYGQPHFQKDSSGNFVLQPYTYFQFGSNVRTWWSLNFTQPGTKFILEVVSVDRSAPVLEKDAHGNVITPNVVLVPGGQLLIHKDVWTWQVVADANTIGVVIDLMHEGAIGTNEVPCIIGEDMYDALKGAQATLLSAVNRVPQDTTAIGNAIFNMEALIVSNCLFTELLSPLNVFPGPNQTFSDGTVVPGIQPPGNSAPNVSFDKGSTAIAGIIDTTEHPCCCKLLVDLEWIAISNKIIGQTPTLPVF